MTPLSFLEKTNFKTDDWVSIINDPRQENPFDKYYQVIYLGNVKDQHVGWLNLEMKRLNELAKKSNVIFPTKFDQKTFSFSFYLFRP